MPHGCAGTTYRLAAKEMAGKAEQVGGWGAGLEKGVGRAVTAEKAGGWEGRGDRGGS